MLRFTIVTANFPGGPGYNVFHTQGDDLSGAQARISAFQDWMSEIASITQNSTTIVLDPVVNLVDPVTGDVLGSTVTTGAQTTGSWGSSHAPAGVCMLARWRTGEYVGGREVRGRTFISGIGDEAAPNGAPAGTFVTAVQEAQDALLAAGDLVIWSPTRGVAPLVSGGSPWNKFALMRSRRD